jgi:hypothetical protein
VTSMLALLWCYGVFAQVLSGLKDFVLSEEHQTVELRRGALALLGELLFYSATSSRADDGGGTPMCRLCFWLLVFLSRYVIVCRGRATRSGRDASVRAAADAATAVATSMC